MLDNTKNPNTTNINTTEAICSTNFVNNTELEANDTANTKSKAANLMEQKTTYSEEPKHGECDCISKLHSNDKLCDVCVLDLRPFKLADSSVDRLFNRKD